MSNDEVLEAMRRQLDCYQRLGKLTKTQHEYVQNSRNEGTTCYWPSGSGF